MRKKIKLVLYLLLISILVIGCGKKEEKDNKTKETITIKKETKKEFFDEVNNRLLKINEDGYLVTENKYDDGSIEIRVYDEGRNKVVSDLTKKDGTNEFTARDITKNEKRFIKNQKDKIHKHLSKQNK